MNLFLDDIQLLYTNDPQLALAKAGQGFEPIECAFGSSSVLGPLAMDHHGSEAWREGVALRAWRDHYAARSADPRFVVTGNADADAILAILCLAALLPKDCIPEGFVSLVNRHDLDPIHLDLLTEPFGIELLAFQQTEHLRRDEASFYRALRSMIALLREGLSPQQRTTARNYERSRIQQAEESELSLLSPHVLYVESRIWGFDRWYRKAPIVVSFSPRHQTITIGCVSHARAIELFGDEGLLAIFPLLGTGWGGRETIGGSPRGKAFSQKDAHHAAQIIISFLAHSEREPSRSR